MNLSYLYSKFFKRFVRGTSILNSKIDKKAKVYSGSNFYNSSIGRYSYVGYDSDVINCEIGAFCSIANGFIAGGARHPLHWVSTSPVFYNVSSGTGFHLGKLPVEPTKRTIIGNDVWIGSRVVIMQGVSIGNGAVIGAVAVVTKNVPAYAIVAGCPAKIIRFRFDPETINKLEDSQWWNYSDIQLKKLSDKMNNPEVFLKAISKSVGEVKYGISIGYGYLAVLCPQSDHCRRAAV